MVATGQEMGVEKSSSRSGKSQGISLQIKGKFNSLKEVRESEILMVHINFLLSPPHSLFSSKLNYKLMLGFRKISPFATLCYEAINSCILHVTC